MPQNPRKIWEKGVLLGEAVEAFCDFDEGQEAHQYERILSNLRGPAKEGNPGNQPDPFHEYTPKDDGERTLMSMRYLPELRGCLVDHLEDSRLLAYGFMIHPQIKDEPEQIPPALFLQVMDEADCYHFNIHMFEGKTTHFRDVRVLYPMDVAVSETRPRGRPPKRPHLEEAVKELTATNPRFATLTIKEARRQVETFLKNVLKIPEAKAEDFSNETLRRVIRSVTDFSNPQNSKSD